MTDYMDLIVLVQSKRYMLVVVDWFHLLTIWLRQMGETKIFLTTIVGELLSLC